LSTTYGSRLFFTLFFFWFSSYHQGFKLSFFPTSLFYMSFVSYLS
jgi:hypothetical protein